MLTRICSLLLFVLVMSAESRAQATPPAAGPAGLIAKVEKASAGWTRAVAIFED